MREGSNLNNIHVACGYAFKRVATLAKYDKDIVLFRGTGKQDVAEHFVSALLDEADEIRDIMSKIVPMELSEKQEEEHELQPLVISAIILLGQKSKSEIMTTSLEIIVEQPTNHAI